MFFFVFHLSSPDLKLIVWNRGNVYIALGISIVNVFRPSLKIVLTEALRASLALRNSFVSAFKTGHSL